MNIREDEHNRGSATHLELDPFESDWSAELSTDDHLKVFNKEVPQSESGINDSCARDWINNGAADDKPAGISPIIPTKQRVNLMRFLPQGVVAGAEGQAAEMLKLVKSSGIYALASVAAPLISLVLAPFLTQHLSPSDYGILALLNITVSFAAGITQLGLASAFFRVYGYDYSSDRDKRDVVATTTTFLFLISLLAAVGVVLLAPLLATSLLGQPSLSGLITIAGAIVLAQNLTVPAFAWLRAESRAFFYALLSLGNLLITLVANVILVGVLHWGIAGSLIATGAGYISIVICTLPVIVFRTGIKIRADITRSLLSFGLPLAFSFVAYWIFQFSDRYLLARFSSLAEAAKYVVVYSLGSALVVVVIGPFILAWPTTMFAIAKRKDAARIFTLVFRWFSLFLLFAAFGLSAVGEILLIWLFPLAYHAGAHIIPIVATSMVFYGIFYIFAVGLNIVRKTWLVAAFTTAAASVNVILNLLLIPHYGATGAALSTLIAYIVLALLTYIANQIIYPIPFEINRFIIALLLGAALYTGSAFLARSQVIYAMCGIYLGALALYSGCLVLIARLPTRNHKSQTDKP